MRLIRRLRRRRLARVAGLALLLALLALALRAEPREVRLPDGRFYRIDLPARAEGAPLIVALHGGGGSPDQFAAASGLARAALPQGYAVVFPAGTGRRGDRLLTWNGGYCCGQAARRGVDDQAYLRLVIADAVARHGLDPDRVYLTGMSNGAILAETFAARAPELVRAVAGVAGTMDTRRVTVAGPVPALVIHGTADTLVPFTGGRGDTSFTQTDFAPVAAVVDAFLRPWGEGLTRTTRQIDRRDDGTRVVITDHAKGGTVVLRLITVEGGGHHWPGGRKSRLERGKTQEIDANTEILRFFALHP
jgi:polyhydroxybutyrate depolymerase